ncbi:MAG: type I-E CRISPR-associated protein Cse2/CasB [Acidaminococcales bacterium]|jgi:CRISPR system Cascade subunit CasB|nr:type I-E CRISPR-associated protein Cse2/CasB [Acidaminococcales bacterium]
MNDYERIKIFVRKKIILLDKETPWAKAALAKLRRGAGKPPGETPEIFDVTLGNLPEELASRGKIAESGPTRAEWAIHTVLTLYALHRQGKAATMNMETKEIAGKKIYGNSLGAAARKLVKSDNEETIKRRFDTIATAKDLAELAHHARGLVQLFKADDIPLDYPRLAEDLYWYQFPDHQNKLILRWGEDFWRGTSGNEREIDKEQKEGAK